MHASWARDVFAAYRAGLLGGDELWCVVLECFDHDRAAALAASVLRVYAPQACPTIDAGVSVSDEFVIDDSDAPAA